MEPGLWVKGQGSPGQQFRSDRVGSRVSVSSGICPAFNQVQVVWMELLAETCTTPGRVTGSKTSGSGRIMGRQFRLSSIFALRSQNLYVTSNTRRVAEFMFHCQRVRRIGNTVCRMRQASIHSKNREARLQTRVEDWIQGRSPGRGLGL